MSKKLVAILMICLLMGLLSSTPYTPLQEETIKEETKFVISSWSYPSDNYGQGIYAMSLYENSTGSWVMAYAFFHNTTTQIFEWNESIGVKFLVGVWYNTTLTGKTDSTAVQNTAKVTLAIKNQTTTFYNATNMTYHYRITADYPMFYLVYQYTASDWVPQNGALYTMTVTYEVFYIDDS